MGEASKQKQKQNQKQRGEKTHHDRRQRAQHLVATWIHPHGMQLCSLATSFFPSLSLSFFFFPPIKLLIKSQRALPVLSSQVGFIQLHVILEMYMCS